MSKLFIDDGKVNKNKTCLTCNHRQRWAVNRSGDKMMQYCGVLKSNRTFNGLKKIKCKDQACEYYE